MFHLSIKGVKAKLVHLVQGHTAPAGGPDGKLAGIQLQRLWVLLWLEC